MSDTEPKLPRPIPKRIIICCDGTWQSAVDGTASIPSNATRLARCLERVGRDSAGKDWHQIVWYDSGVGTTSGWVGKKLEGAVGNGLEGNVIEAYNFCVLNYQQNDQILIFGFSRGAYTARSIAGLISDIGICKPQNLGTFHEIWKLYKDNPGGKRFFSSDQYFDYMDGVLAEPEDQPDDLGYKNVNQIWKSPPHDDWATWGTESREIEVVGVYDTVGALGMPSVLGYKSILFGPDKHGTYNVRLNPNIKRAFHALALDEHREAFSPTMWHLPDRQTCTQQQVDEQEKVKEDLRAEWSRVGQNKNVPKPERDAIKAAFFQSRRDFNFMKESMKPRSDLRQVWFPGVHINIGGGSSDTLEDKGDLEETSNITFSWMLDQISPYVAIDRQTVLTEALARRAHVDKLNRIANKNKDDIEAEAKAVKNSSWGAWIGKKVSSATSSVTSTVMHPLTDKQERNTELRKQGWGTGTIIDSYTSMYWANGSKPRTPGQYKFVDDNKKDQAGRTNEQIHPTVGWRIEATKNEPDVKKRYSPSGAKEGKFVRKEKAGGGYEYFIDGLAKPMPEWELKCAAPGADPLDLPYERYAVLGQGAIEHMIGVDRRLGNKPQMMGNPVS